MASSLVAHQLMNVERVHNISLSQKKETMSSARILCCLKEKNETVDHHVK
jgi:hypothetical protein